MKSIVNVMLIRQCLSLLPLEKFACPLMNYGKKLGADALIKIFVSAQLGKWESYEDMEEKLRAYPDLRKDLRLTSISGSQLSRRINEFPTEQLQDLFFEMINHVRSLTKKDKGLPKGIGRLNLVDSTHIKLPENLSNWAFVTQGWTVVKMHTRLVVTSVNTVFPDKIVPSTGIVSDFEGSDILVEESDATYVMDRGYASLMRLAYWLEKEILFVVRIKEQTKITVLENALKSDDSHILTDAKVLVGSSRNQIQRPLRLVEYTDEKGHRYRIITNRWDLEASQIAEIYRHRWQIETFFKWIKQHIRLTKLWSTKPQGIWNQMYLALIAFAVTLLVQQQLKTNKTMWQLLRLIRTYFNRTYQEFLNEVHRKKSKTSKGRQKVPDKPKETVDIGNVALSKVR
ncbi:IS4 family transposase [Alkalihalobacillus sp. MEB130]|uniref:IS4 family transposase n=1 Tax=Alkalihalobacillus sp. MEB130 TaxID=2976704 RepID=UPI0028DDAE08|nr:IS4 family transposase [Alkalihalobacillus sp. MEB130]MDT8863104.1 IS4 family transposase [Alkalihalobacillus sp. MEB130]